MTSDGTGQAIGGQTTYCGDSCVQSLLFDQTTPYLMCPAFLSGDTAWNLCEMVKD